MHDARIRIIHLCDDIQLQVMFGCNGKHGFHGTRLLILALAAPGVCPHFSPCRSTPRLHVTDNHVIFDAPAFQAFLRSIDKNL